jgi:hypothetical protein
VLEKLDDLVFGNSYNGGRRDIPFDDSTQKGIAQSFAIPLFISMFGC